MNEAQASTQALWGKPISVVLRATWSDHPPESAPGFQGSSRQLLPSELRAIIQIHEQATSCAGSIQRVGYQQAKPDGFLFSVHVLQREKATPRTG